MLRSIEFSASNRETKSPWRVEAKFVEDWEIDSIDVSDLGWFNKLRMI